jgi:hypothetical protein
VSMERLASKLGKIEVDLGRKLKSDKVGTIEGTYTSAPFKRCLPLFVTLLIPMENVPPNMIVLQLFLICIFDKSRRNFLIMVYGLPTSILKC